MEGNKASAFNSPNFRKFYKDLKKEGCDGIPPTNFYGKKNSAPPKKAIAVKDDKKPITPKLKKSPLPSTRKLLLAGNASKTLKQKPTVNASKIKSTPPSTSRQMKINAGNAPYFRKQLKILGFSSDGNSESIRFSHNPQCVEGGKMPDAFLVRATEKFLSALSPGERALLVSNRDDLCKRKRRRRLFSANTDFDLPDAPCDCEEMERMCHHNMFESRGDLEEERQPFEDNGEKSADLEEKKQQCDPEIPNIDQEERQPFESKGEKGDNLEEKKQQCDPEIPIACHEKKESCENKGEEK